MPIHLNGKDLTVESVTSIARGDEEVAVAPDALERIIKCRAMLEDKVQKQEVMYGVTTGIGELAEVVLDPDQTENFQKFLIYSHAAGCGEPIPEDGVRAAIASRINVHCNGRSGLRPVITQTLVDMLNKGVTPVVCQRGSVGACGDLSPMAQMALVPIGEGEAFYKGQRLPGKEAMDQAGVPVVTYAARDGLAVINGSNMTSGMGCLQVVDTTKWYKSLNWTRRMFNIELNGVGDNPLFFPETDDVVTGANFQGTPLAFGLELMGVGVTTIGVLSERRLNRLMNPALNVGLPAYLTKGAGMMSGLMLTQYTAGSLICENRIMSHPAATGSIPAAADQEDFVSMGMTSAIKTREIIKNSMTVLAIEYMAAAQAIDFRKPTKPGPASQAAYDVIRKYVEFLDDDRPLYNDINKMSEVVSSGEIVEAVENVTGPLSASDLIVDSERYAF